MSAFPRRAGRCLPAEVIEALSVVAAEAAELELEVLMVGGAVRDVLLDRSTRDVDLVVIGDPRPLVEGVAGRLGGEAGSGTPFMTQRVDLPTGGSIDFGAARRETYDAPGQLPRVAAGGLEDDLARRDFSINAMAVPPPPSWGEIVDPFAARCDLRRRELRILHDRSFEDDPTRVLRGLELAVRLGFDFASATRAAARRALAAGALDTLSTARLRTAWARSFGRLALAGGASLARGLQMSTGLGLGKALGAVRGWQEAQRQAVERLAACVGRLGASEEQAGRVLLRFLAADSPAAADRLAALWGATPAERDAWRSWAERSRAPRHLARGPSPRDSKLDDVLGAVDEEELCLLAAEEEALELLVERYLSRVRGFELTIGGADLLAAGHGPGREIGRALERTRRRRLDGEIGQEDELEYACRQVEELRR